MNWFAIGSGLALCIVGLLALTNKLTIERKLGIILLLLGAFFVARGIGL